MSLSFAALATAPSDAHLAARQRDVLTQYLSALHARQYTEAFRLLSDDERRYFGSAANFTSAYAAARLEVDSYRILGSMPMGNRTVSLVSEHVRFFDFVRRRPIGMVAEVEYAIGGPADSPRIEDPNHPWKAFAPALGAVAHGLRATVDAISFFPGRIDVVATFANLGRSTVTLLPYGKSVVRDEARRAYFPIRSRSEGLTDRRLFVGVRLRANTEYTGHIQFFTPNRFSPKALSFTFAPALLDGAGAPFEIALPPAATRFENSR